MRRLLVKALAALTMLLVVSALGAYGYLRRSLPQITGTIETDGVTAPVEIVRDANAVPHIFAASRLDALFGLGYVHAQDRLWQMEFQRRIGFGRLSEIFGAATLPQDRFLRTVGFGRAARSAWTNLPDAVKRPINAYVAGVNAFIATHRGSRLPPEFTLLRFEPEPWEGPDVVVWQKMLAWDLSANYSFELLRHDIVDALGAERLAELMPPYRDDGLSILTARDMEQMLPAQKGGGTSQASRAPAREMPHGAVMRNLAAAFTSALSHGEPAVRDLLLGAPRTESLGSNNWVVDGTLSASGKPILANDPHLGTRLPSTWYLVHLSTGTSDVIGGSIPGTPAIVLGRNRFIAWGATNVAADVEDLYRERLDPTGRFAEFQGQLEPLQLVTETVQVKGREPVSILVRISRHGPLVSDAINANNASLESGRPVPPPIEPLAFRWTALDADDTTVAASLAMSEARDWGEFTSALRQFVVPSQNFVYADVNGHIGYYAPGRIPIRKEGDGSRPADGWTGAAEWIGWIPFEALPHSYDPPEHFIVTANQRPMPSGYPHLLGLEWPESYRARRIIDRLKQGTAMTPRDFASIQADTRSLHAEQLLPLLLARVRPVDALDRQAVEMLRQWDFDARGDSAAAAIFEAWFLRLVPDLVGDDLGPLITENYEGRFSFVTRFLIGTLAASDPFWCDDRRTPKQESCDEAVTIALHEALGELTRRLGGNLSAWRWDAIHRAVFPHQGLDSVPVLRFFLSRSVPSAGDWSTVNVGTVAVDHPFEQRSVPGYRQIIDLSPQDDSRFLDAVGESGHALSTHYDDYLERWRTVDHLPMKTNRADVERGALGLLRLAPRARQD